MLDNYCGPPYIKARRGYDSVQPLLADPAERQGFFI